MLNTKTLLGGLLSVLSIVPVFAAVNDDYEVRTIVDSLRAVKMINREINRVNAPTNRAIANMQTDLAAQQSVRSLTADSLGLVKRLADMYGPKIKDKEQAMEFQLYLVDELRRMTDDEILSAADPKKVEKARNSKKPVEEIAHLVTKTTEKQLKEAGKGNMEKTILGALLSARIDSFQKKLREYDTTIDATNDSLLRLQSELLPAVETFDRFTFRKWLPDGDYPVRIVRESLAGTGRHSFRYYAEKYPLQLLNGITGKFDGMLEDRLYMFPLESSIEPESYGDWIVAHRLVLKSEKGTVPECIVGGVNDEDYEDLAVLFSNEWSTESIMTLHDQWESEAPSRDGVYISVGHGEDQQEDNLTYVFDVDKWVNRPPLNPQYMSYDECLRLLPERVISKEQLHYKWSEDDDLELYEDGSIDLITVASADGGTAYVKSTVIDDLCVPLQGLTGWKIIEDTPRDILVFFYDDSLIHLAEMYSIWWSGPYSKTLNGNEIDCCFCLDKVGVITDYDSDEKRRFIKIHSYQDPVKDGWFAREYVYNESSDDIKTAAKPISEDEMRTNMRRFCHNMGFPGDSVATHFNGAQAEKLLRGGAFKVPKSGEIERIIPIGKNILVQILTAPEKQDKWSDYLEQNRYITLYTPEGQLLDAVWVGDYISEEESKKKDYSNDRTRLVWTAPHEFKIQSIKTVDRDNVKFSSFNELNYEVVDDKIKVKDYLWNIGDFTSDDEYDYVWPWMEPVRFLYRFPLKSTPWNLWSEYALHTDGENCEGMYESDLPRLYERNPEMFLKEAAKVFTEGADQYSNAAYMCIYGGSDFVSAELREDMRKNMRKYLTPAARDGLLQELGQE